METAEARFNRVWPPHDRLQPWAIYDLERLAWVIEQRAADLTTEEREIVRDAAARMSRAVELVS